LGENIEQLLGELVEAVRRAGRKHPATLRREGLLVTGNA
jgi:hypothetical protein